MLRTMITATNTMSQLQQQMDIIGNNLTNSDTAGYKSRDARFQELLFQQFDNDRLDRAPRTSPDGIRYGTGAMLNQVTMNTKQGVLKPTGRELDFALKTPGHYFKVRMETETGIQDVYTRQGAFQAMPAGPGELQLVTNDGYAVLDADNNPIRFSSEASSYELTEAGVLRILYPDGTDEAAALAVTAVNRPQLMEQIGGSYIGLPDMAALGLAEADVLTELQGEARQLIDMEQKSLESSNVNMQKEMTDLLNAQRSYQFNSRAVSLADQMLGLINGVR